MDGEPVIRARGLKKSYGAVEAVRGVDIDVFAGEIFGLIGPDGAGKTTCFNMLAGILQPTAGELTVLGRAAADVRTGIGYLTQQFSLYEDLSVDENLQYAAGMRLVPEEAFRERRERYLKIMGLEPFGARTAGALSGGMKQKLALCCALIAEPRVLLLDEPTTGVDPISRREFWRVVARLAESGVAIVIATPYLDEAERCRSVALMYDGSFHRVGKPRELRDAEGLHRLEIRVDDLRHADVALTELANAHAATIVDVQPFGDRIDVLAHDQALAEAGVRERLAREQIEIVALTDEEPTLENVFVLDLHANLATAERSVPFPGSRNGRQRSRTGTAIQARALSKRFGAFTAVDHVSLSVAYGEIYGLLGANGAGKTTTIKMLCGLLASDEGQVTIAGVAHDLRSPELRRRIGYMSQKFTLYDDLTIGENLEFYAGIYGIPRAERAAKIDWVLEELRSGRAARRPDREAPRRLQTARRVRRLGDARSRDPLPGRADLGRRPARAARVLALDRHVRRARRRDRRDDAPSRRSRTLQPHGPDGLGQDDRGRLLRADQSARARERLRGANRRHRNVRSTRSKVSCPPGGPPSSATAFTSFSTTRSASSPRCARPSRKRGSMRRSRRRRRRSKMRSSASWSGKPHEPAAHRDADHQGTASIPARPSLRRARVRVAGVDALDLRVRDPLGEPRHPDRRRR